MLTRLMAAVVGLMLIGATAHADIVKNFEFNVDGVLPSDDPEIELFIVGAGSETDVYSVSGGLLEQRSLTVDGNYSYRFPDATLTGGELDPAQSLVMEARLKILGIEGMDGAYFEAFDGLNRYGPLFDEGGKIFFDAAGAGPFITFADIR